MDAIQSIVVNWWVLLPVIVIFGGAVVGVLIEAFIPAKARRLTNFFWSLMVILGALVCAGLLWSDVSAEPTTTGEFVADSLTVSLQLILLTIAFLALLVFGDRSELQDGAFAAQPADRPGSGEEALSLQKKYQRSEFFPLMLFSLGGMMMFPATDSLLTMFVALEVMSLPLYILAATARRGRLASQEAGIKYFLLGAFASGFFLMGSALLYGFSGGSLQLGQIAGAITQFDDSMIWMLIMGVFMVMVGLLFKVAVVPFHAWAPDVYTGAPTPVTGFMAAGVKIAAFGALLRFYQSVGAHLSWDLGFLVALLAALTIIVGTVIGLVQKDVKRLLAYSSIAHAGFLMIGVLSLVPGSSAHVAFYLLAYGVATIGAFAVITLVRQTDDAGNILGEATSFSAYKGLARRSPFLAGSMLIFLLSFAGIPFTSGFIGKFVVFADGIAGGLGWLVGIALGASAATAAFYFAVVARIFFQKPEPGVEVVKSEGYTTVAISVAVLATLAMGVWPDPILDLLSKIVILLP